MTLETKFLNRAANLVGAYGNYATTPDQVDAETIALARCQLIAQSMDIHQVLLQARWQRAILPSVGQYLYPARRIRALG